MCVCVCVCACVIERDYNNCKFQHTIVVEALWDSNHRRESAPHPSPLPIHPLKIHRGRAGQINTTQLKKTLEALDVPGAVAPPFHRPGTWPHRRRVTVVGITVSINNRSVCGGSHIRHSDTLIWPHLPSFFLGWVQGNDIFLLLSLPSIPSSSYLTSPLPHFILSPIIFHLSFPCNNRYNHLLEHQKGYPVSYPRQDNGCHTT